MDAKSPWIVVVFFAIPFVTFATMFIVLLAINKRTTGEIKLILPPETLVKVMAIISIVVVTFVLAYMKILEQAVVATILGSVAAGTIGLDFKGKS